MTEDTPQVSAVSVKLPPFWAEEPEIWFDRVDSIFRLRGITTEQTKFDHVIAVLPLEFMRSARQEISNPHRDKPYEKLREALLEKFAKHPIQHLLDTIQSFTSQTDLSPSQIEDVCNSVSCNIDTLREALFVLALPHSIKGPILDKLKAGSSLKEARKTAESLLAQQPAQFSVSAVHNNKGKAGYHKGAQGASGNPNWCYMHNRYGERAYNCRQPCSYKRDRAGKGRVNALTYEQEEASGNDNPYHQGR